VHIPNKGLDLRTYSLGLEGPGLNLSLESCGLGLGRGVTGKILALTTSLP